MKSRILTPVIVAFFASLFCACQNSDMARIPKNDAKGTADFYIDLYEAHIETDSTGIARAVSTQGVLPATGLPFDQAKAACEAAKKRLCGYLEWQVACEGSNLTSFGFQDSSTSPIKVSDVCNVGKSVDSTNALQNTGKNASCKSDTYGVFDMIGNVSEWTIKSGNPDISGSSGTSDTSSDANFNCLVETDPSVSGAATSAGFRCCKTP